MKRYKIRILTLMALLALVLGVLFAFPVKGALAASYYSPTEVFSSGGSATVGGSETVGQQENYINFNMEDGGVVNYRHNLALKWYESKGEASYLSMTFGVKELNFKTLTVSFESEQENINKQKTSKNEVIFTSDGTSVTVAIKADGETEPTAAVAVADYTNVTLKLTDDSMGAFTLTCNDVVVGKLTNVGGYYLNYASSAATTPRVPLSFSVDLLEGKSLQVVEMKSLNKQSFALTAEGKVTDTAFPVLVINEDITSFVLGHKFSIDNYVVIDVLAAEDVITTTREYVYYKAPAEGETEKDAEELSNDSYKAVASSETLYLQEQTSGSGKEYVSVRLKMRDSRISEEASSTKYAYVAWYCIPTGDAADAEKLAKSYIPVLRDEVGPQYTCVTNDDVAHTSTLSQTQAVTDYQVAVSEASENISAGKKSYYYLPSLRSIIADNYTGYNALTFDIYYKHQSSATGKSVTSVKYNALSFEVDKEGFYSFRAVAKDKLSNTIKVYNADGRLVEVTANNVWDLDCIPEFTFSIAYKGATIDQPKTQSLGSLKSLYSVSEFDVVALDGYEVEHTLYFLDQNKITTAGAQMPTYTEMVENPSAYAQYLEEITSADEDTDWNPVSITFRPQEAGFYFVKATVIDTVFRDDVSAYKVIEVRNPVDEVVSETYWLENNVTSVVLFSIAGVLLIVIVVLWLVKPSNKKVEEVDMSKMKGQKKD